MWRRLIYHPEINYALRQTLVLCLPVAVGLLIGQLHLGLLFSLVPACCNIAGLDTPHKRFFKRLIIGASLFAGCSLVTQLLLAESIPLPLILTGLTLVLGVTAEISPASRAVTASVADCRHLYPESCRIHARLGAAAHLCAGHAMVRRV